MSTSRTRLGPTIAADCPGLGQRKPPSARDESARVGEAHAPEFQRGRPVLPWPKGRRSIRMAAEGDTGVGPREGVNNVQYAARGGLHGGPELAS